MIKLEKQGGVLKSELSTQFQYTFDKVFDSNSKQDDIYVETTKQTVQEVLNGKNCTVFAYGSTGAGKTYTMMGTENNPGSYTSCIM